MLIVCIAFVLIVLALCAVIVFLIKTHREETKDLHLRLASRSLEDYHYWRDGHQLEVEHNREVLKSARSEKVETREETPEERKKREAAKGF